MEVTATLKNVGLSPQKARLVARQLKGLNVANALAKLNFLQQKAAFIVKKVLDSAIANAEHNEGADIDALVVQGVCIDEAPSLKRFRARAKGRGNRILKRHCHIKVTVVAAS